jgi:hypothetical protein
MTAPERILIFNAGLQIFVSAFFGFLLLIPMQPWAQKRLPRIPSVKDAVAAHIDWLMLGMMQFGAAFGMSRFPTPYAAAIVALLIFGGWVNATPYLFRGLLGINAFVFAGNLRQRLAAGLGGFSSLTLLAGWGLLLAGWARSL